MKTKQTREFESSQIGEWKCPNCKRVAFCGAVGYAPNRKPIVKCAQCGHRFETGRAGMMEGAKRAKIIME